MVRPKIKTLHIAIASMTILVVGGFIVLGSNNEDASSPQRVFSAGVPQDPIHWHPTLAIYINDEPYPIPVNIGITVGKVMDTEVSGMRMSPMHTHTSDGVIHMEQNAPTARTIRLGYFFEVWDKTFTSECIFEYCNTDDKTVQMFVNGVANTEFGGYLPKDGDEIVIRYE